MTISVCLDASTSNNLLKSQWESLKLIPINSDDEIEKPFLHFDVGTDRFEIWKWFEESYDVDIKVLIDNF